MPEQSTIRSRLLGRAAVYSAFRKVLRADRATKLIVNDHIKPGAGSRVLDLGCGNGELVPYLGNVDYVGVDHNAGYLQSARRSAGADARFVDADLATLDSLDIGTFDVVVALGVLHHLDSEVATNVIAAASGRLRDGGRFVTLDPAFHPEQRSIARVLMALDRGLYVRHPEDYDRLVATAFPTRAMTIRTDLIPFPYTHCIIEACR